MASSCQLLLISLVLQHNLHGFMELMSDQKNLGSANSY